MKTRDLNNMKFSIMGGLPASETNYSISGFKKMLDAYKSVKHADLRAVSYTHLTLPTICSV